MNVSEKRLTTVAQRLRHDPTEAEKRLWARLKGRQLGVQFTRQWPIGGHIADFACRRTHLVIELDGGQHANSATDADRTALIEAHGYRVIRFWNNDVLENIEGVLATIVTELTIAQNRPTS